MEERHLMLQVDGVRADRAAKNTPGNSKGSDITFGKSAAH